ncbi:MAG: hypothetical protein LBG60_03880 [Bifidobacteriaceae bacterium]|jgi:hypothetical protein|nr:hypothetical protein [Bifidobacteriaceae bacterium]
MKLNTTRRFRWTAALAFAALAAAGCGGAEPGADSSAPPPSSSPSDAGGEDGWSELAPGVSGTIAAVTDGLLQVQDSEKQTAVGYSAETVITEQVAGSAADVVVGVCVAAVGEASDAAATSSEDSVFAAATVAVTSAEGDGTCASAGFGGGFGGFGGSGGSGEWPEGEFPEGMPTDRPSGAGGPGQAPEGGFPEGMPSDLPSDLPSDMGLAPGPEGDGEAFGPGGGVAANMAFGLVTAVDGETVSVQQSGRGGFGGGAEAAESPAADESEPVTRVFTIGAAEITATKAADASALEVGKCVVAQGQTDASGRVEAESLAVSTPGEDGCLAAAGGGRGAGFGGAAGGGAPPGTDGAAQADPSGAGGRAPRGRSAPDSGVPDAADESGSVILEAAAPVGGVLDWRLT